MNGAEQFRARLARHPGFGKDAGIDLVKADRTRATADSAEQLSPEELASVSIGGMGVMGYSAVSQSSRTPV